MTREQTCYQLLGIDQQATLSQIRRAYVKLVKEYHPDADASDSSGVAAAWIRQINGCYTILKDPAKRAADDAGLRTRQTTVPAPRPSTAGRRRRQDSAAEWRSLLIIASFLPLILLISYVGGAVISFAAEAAYSVQDRPTASLLSPALPSRSQLYRQVNLATSMSGSRAVNFSRRCFESAKRIEDGTAVELCIVFDNAQLYWGRTTSLDFPMYFRDPMATMRHADELAPYEDHVDKELLELRSITFNILLNEVAQTDTHVDASATNLREPGTPLEGESDANAP